MDLATESDLTATLTDVKSLGRRALVFAPHPDDEVFGCGGTLCLLAAAGASISVVIVSDGALGGAATGLVEMRETESRAASELLGYPPPTFWRLPDRGVRYGEALVTRMLAAIESAQADLVFAPAITEIHPDHQAISLAVAEAMRRLGGNLRVALYEISAPLLPNTLVDIGTVEARKLQSMRCFHSQLLEQPYDEAIASLNRYRAYHHGPAVRAAEAFCIVNAADLNEGFTPLFESAADRRRRLGFAVEGNDFPLVSIVICSNDRPGLADVLLSVASQTYPNIEVIVVNATGKPHSRLPNLGHRLIVHLVETEVAQSRSSAINAGVDAVTGRYLLFLNDENQLPLPDHVNKLVKALQGSGVRAAYSGVRQIDSGGNEMRIFDESWAAARLMVSDFIPAHAILLDCSLTALGCRFDECMEPLESWDFALQLAQHTSFVHVPGISAVSLLRTEDPGLLPEHTLERQFNCRRLLYSKWRNTVSDQEWSDALCWYAQQMDRTNELANASSLQNTVLLTKTSALEKQNADLTGRKAILEWQNADLSQRSLALDRQNAGLTERNVILERQNADLSQRNLALDRQNAGLAERNVILERQNADLSQRNLALDRQNAGLTANNLALVKQDAILVDRNINLTERNAGLTDHNAILSDRNAVLSYRNATMETDLIHERGKMVSELATARDALNAVLASHSWKATAPLRWLIGLLRH